MMLLNKSELTLPSKLIADAMTNRSKQVVKSLKKGSNEITIHFLEWISAKERMTTINPFFLKEVYFFVKHNYWDTRILFAIHEMSRNIFNSENDTHLQFNIHAFIKDFCNDAPLNAEKAKSKLKSLSERERVALYSPNSDGNCAFHCLNGDPELLELFEKHCPPKLRIHLFSKNKDGMTPLAIYLETHRHTNAMIEFMFNRAPPQQLGSLYECLDARKIIANCSLDILETFLKHIPTGLEEKKLIFADVSLLGLCCEEKADAVQRARILLENTPQAIRGKYFESEDPLEVPFKTFVESVPERMQAEMKKLCTFHCPTEILEAQLARLDQHIALAELMEHVENVKKSEAKSEESGSWD